MSFGRIMKHQYFGDINDYLKYGILRCFAEQGFRVGVCWMMTPDDGRPDGQKMYYLSQPDKWKSHDPPLFDALFEALARPDGKHLRHLESMNVIPHGQFFGEVVPDGRIDRAVWFKQARAALSGSDFLFFDPDNGIEVRSKPLGRKHSSKYVYWEELGEAWNGGASVLVFQHFARVKRDGYVSSLLCETAKRIPGSVVIPLRTQNVLFLFACRVEHRARAHRAIELLGNRWSGCIWTSK
jgi:hypothetical protein